MAYSWLTFAAGRQQLAARLADPNNAFWLDGENGVYITEALRVWNALTFTWKVPFVFQIAAASKPTWYSLGAMANSPRLRTLTDTALYTVMEFHLLEPPTGGTWTGTSQFGIADLSLALQRCRDEAIQVSNCNQVNPAPLGSTPNTTTLPFPDTFLDISRARFVPNAGVPTTLVRNDETGWNFYQTGYLQTPAATPSQYNVASVGPLTMEVDVAPVNPGNYDVIALAAGPTLAPPTPSLLNVPDDFGWVLKWGALADLLGRESEATDRPRAQYCQQRYTQGLGLMRNTPWVMEAQINGVPASFVSVAEMDQYRPEWDSGPADFQIVVTSGMDFFTVVPTSTQPLSVELTVLANAPIPVLDGDFIQCSRDAWDSVLDYAQFLASFKQGGAEFAAAQVLEQGFFSTAISINGRLQKLGLFSNVFTEQAKRQERDQERFAKQ